MDLWTFLATLLLLPQFKASGLIVSVVLGAIVAGYFLISHNKNRNRALIACVFLVVLFVISLWYPYGKNLWIEGAPFYPYYLSNNDAYIGLPPDLKDMYAIQKFLASLFATGGASPDDPIILKIPFTTSISEILLYGNSDVRLAGFGPLFSGAVLASVFGLLIWFFQTPSYKKKRLAAALRLNCGHNLYNNC